MKKFIEAVRLYKRLNMIFCNTYKIVYIAEINRYLVLDIGKGAHKSNCQLNNEVSIYG